MKINIADMKRQKIQNGLSVTFRLWKTDVIHQFVLALLFWSLKLIVKLPTRCASGGGLP